MIEFYRVVDIIDQSIKHKLYYSFYSKKTFWNVFVFMSTKPTKTVRNVKPFVEGNKIIFSANGEIRS